ncbi:MFS transporter [Allosalinactinospora lopnorensis]|uniref:MFS transporter n=1 Tax=Allosalinactinospora lopnorensis TaxID=1352348 RepID=UPI0012E185BE
MKGDRQPSLTTGVLCLAVLVFASAQTSVAPAIPQMARDLGSTTQTAAWSFTAYMVSAAVLTPVVGRLGDMFGKRRLLAIVLGLFALGALVAATVARMDVVILGRVVQAPVGGSSRCPSDSSETTSPRHAGPQRSVWSRRLPASSSAVSSSTSSRSRRSSGASQSRPHSPPPRCACSSRSPRRAATDGSTGGESPGSAPACSRSCWRWVS